MTNTPPPATTANASEASVLSRKPSTVEKQEFTFKIIVIGDADTGKTAFLHRYVQSRFEHIYKTTVSQLKVVTACSKEKNMSFCRSVLIHK